MKTIKIKCLAIVVFVICLILPQQSKSSGNSFIEKNVPVIELKGTGYERGVQYGTLLKNEIAEIFVKWKKNITVSTKRDADSVLAEFLKATNFEPVIKKLTPEVLEEVKGIAAGSNQKYSDVYAFQLVDEFWVYIDKLSNVKNHHCSGLGIAAVKNRPAVVAQNLDMENYANGYQVLVHIAETKTEPEQYIFSFAGLVAANGLNEKGIGICVNTISELRASEDGLPVAYIVRGILSKQTGEDALSFMKTTKHASGQNYILGIRDSVYNFEASANKVVRYVPKGGNGSVIYHTNHAIVNHDVKEWFEEYHKKLLSGEAKRNDSIVRFLSLENRLNKPLEEITVDVIKTTFRSKDDERSPLCRPYHEGWRIFTLSSVIYTLGNKPFVQLSYGPPDQAEYIEHYFTGK